MAIQTTSERLRLLLPDLYRSLDVRTVALRYEGRWINAVTIIRWHTQHPENTQKLLDELRDSHPQLNCPDIRVLMSGFDFGEWDEFARRLSEGQMTVAGENIETVPLRRL